MIKKSSDDAKITIIGGEGDFLYACAKDEHDGEPNHIAIFMDEDGEKRKPNETTTKYSNKSVTNWDVKIYLPTKDSFLALYKTLQAYAIEKWGKIPDSEDDMKAHIGTKIIKAEPMSKDVFNDKFDRKNNIGPNLPGYHVSYPQPDGSTYDSWSPKEVFERSYREIKNDELGFIL